MKNQLFTPIAQGQFFVFTFILFSWKLDKREEKKTGGKEDEM